MATTKRLSKNWRVKISESSHYNSDGQLVKDFTLTFQRRVWWFVWEYVYPFRYFISVYNFWQAGPKYKEAIFASTILGEQGEAWLPHAFNIDKRINDIFSKIEQQ